MGRVLLAGFIASLIMMIWGTFYWMALPTSIHGFKAAPNEDSALAVLARELPASGVYVLPFPPNDMSDEHFNEKHKTGPIAQIFYRAEGVDPLNNKVMFEGWVHAFICALLMAVLVAMTHNGLQTFAKRWLFVTLTGIFATVSMEGLYPIWWHHVWGYHFAVMFGQVINWLLAGLVIAYIVKIKQPS
ncbi:MAG: hypothetical protein K0S11_1885 [Gammaproteobacteria bacterium]|jgi:hypothetical protein|nr:hypothetical protein [Gammaproteobacteria bacterium]